VSWQMAVSGADPVPVRVRGRAADAVCQVGDGPQVRCSGALSGSRLTVTADGLTRGYAVARDGEVLWLGRDGSAWAVRELAPLDAAAAAEEGAGGPVRSPMPGTVTVVETTEGAAVSAGDRLLVVEAMKMEHVLTAPVDGVVRNLRAVPGGTVARDDVLLVVEPATGED
jgi:acetyl-CoA/propionyl-CoA carboxylase biotin carboxyl carrier protein